MKTSSPHDVAFSVLEVVLVLSTVAILLLLKFPLAKGYMERSRSVACLQNLRQLHTGVMNYAAEHNMEFPMSRTHGPTATAWYMAITPYVPHGGYGKKRPPYHCQANPTPITPSGNAGHTNYAINSNVYIRDSSLAKDGEDYAQLREVYRLTQVSGNKALLLDSYNGDAEKPSTWYRNAGSRYSNPWGHSFEVHGDSVNVIFVDGHVESPSVTPRQLRNTPKGIDCGEIKAEWFWPMRNP